MKKILVTGGSGFIGTNVISHLLNNNQCQVLNLDLQKPKLSEHLSFWQKIDLLDRRNLIVSIKKFNPTHVIHLAARTDLMGKNLDDYKSNTKGVQNLIDALSTCTNIQRVVFASSMLVCKVGYQPQSDTDYAPSTLYGKSKVEMENIIRSQPHSYEWCIIRPTSIWGPWFGEPYANFFKMILSHQYVNLGKHACTKTYGFIDNAVFQITSLLYAPNELIEHRVFYLGDYNPYNISEWALEIGEIANIKIPTIPFFLFKLAAWGGDLLKMIGIRFPMTSFRLKNMTTDNIIDMSDTQHLVPNLPINRKEGTIQTINWINNNLQS